MDAIKNLAVVELDATELAMLVGGDEDPQQNPVVHVGTGSTGGTTTATATVKAK
jgi:hypothetical protein